MVGTNLAALGGFGIGVCWGWLLAPVLRAALLPLAWGTASSVLVAATCALAGAAAVPAIAGYVARRLWLAPLRRAAR